MLLDAKLLGVVCSACQRQNPLRNKFCSRCGGVLSSAQPGSSENQATPFAPEEASPRPANDVQWLRNRAFDGMDGSDVSPGRRWKYLVGAAAIVLAGFVYLQWAPSPKTGVASTTAAPQAEAPLAPENSSSAENRIPAETSSPESKGEVQHIAAGEARHDRAAVPAGLEPASQKSPLLDAAGSPRPMANLEGGASDLRLAQRYLGGSTGVRDSSEAAKLLWKAVAKQNTTAAVLLSDLYLRGDGVPRSCDQARLLLVAAAKRGASQAAQQLQRLESQGCH